LQDVPARGAKTSRKFIRPVVPKDGTANLGRIFERTKTFERVLLIEGTRESLEIPDKSPLGAAFGWREHIPQNLEQILRRQTSGLHGVSASIAADTFLSGFDLRLLLKFLANLSDGGLRQPAAPADFAIR
jgi:hypothetical protein